MLWIRSDRLFLRPWETSDAGKLVILSHDAGFAADVGAFSRPMDLDSAREWIVSSGVTPQSRGLGSWAVLWHGQLIGTVALAQRRLDGENQDLLTLEYRLSEGARGKGLATEAVQALIDFASKEYHHDHFYAFIPPNSLAAKRVAFKLSMTFLKSGCYQGHAVEVYHCGPAGAPPKDRCSEESAA